MLNRLYIVVGILAIFVLIAAFVVPRFLDWGEYRERLEMLAEEAVGADVTVRGEFDFTLLPQPTLRIADVVVGPVEAPVAVIASATAEFSLMDFLRDRYEVTSVALDGVELNLRIDEEGQLDLPLALADGVGATNVSLADATLTNTAVRLTDSRSGEIWHMSGIEGSLEASGLRGPFALHITGDFEGAPHTVRLTSSVMNPDGAMQLTAFLKPENGAFSLSGAGLLRTGPAPSFAGEVTYRQTAESTGEEVRGDLVLTGEVEARTDEIQLSSYVLLPDENRATTRLTGAGEITLGADRAFDIVVSGGVVGLTPRDAREAADDQPYELLRLLVELPVPLLPPLPGRIGIDITELNLRAFSFHNVRLDATTDGENWFLDDFKAMLPGNTALTLAGRLSREGDRPAFDGRMTIKTNRLDSLAAMWRRPEEGTPLFNMPGALDVQVALNGDRLALTDGVFLLDGTAHLVSAEIDYGAEKHLKFAGDFGELGRLQSQALADLVPPVTGSEQFARSFPTGEFAVLAEGAALFGLDGEGLALAGNWGEGAIRIERAKADTLGGSSFDLTGTLSGTLAAPQIVATGSAGIAEGAGFEAAMTALGADTPVREVAVHLLPATLDVEISEAGADGAQSISLMGPAGESELSVILRLSNGLSRAFAAPMTIAADLTSDNAAALTRQLGLGDFPIVPDRGDMRVSLTGAGTLTNSLQSEIAITGGGDRVRYEGSLVLSNPSLPRGTGTLDYDVSDLSTFATIAGADGVFVPGIRGTASLSFVGTQTFGLTDIAASGEGTEVTGDLNLTTQGGVPLIAGNLDFSRMDVAALAALLGGPAALIGSQGSWPDGPLFMGDNLRQSNGRLQVTSPVLTSGGEPLLRDVAMDVIWDENSLRLRGLNGAIGGGTASLDLTVCCTGQSFGKRASGRLSLDDVSLDAVMPDAPATALAGIVSGSARFDGAGESIAGIIGGLSGEGSFTLTGLEVQHFDPAAFNSLARVENILELEVDDLTRIAAAALEQGPFVAPEMGGAFTLAGGTIRISNLAAESDDARLLGGATLDLASLDLDSSWTLTPTGSLGGNGLIGENTSGVTANVGGTIMTPERTLEIAPMVDAMKMRALEEEVERLEALRAEEVARARAAAEEQARRLEEEAAQLLAEEQARAAAQAAVEAEAEAARLAEQAAAALAVRLAEEEAAAIAEAEAARQAERDAAEDTGPAEEPAAVDLAADEASEPTPVEETPTAPPEDAPIDLFNDGLVPGTIDLNPNFDLEWFDTLETQDISG